MIVSGHSACRGVSYQVRNLSRFFGGSVVEATGLRLVLASLEPSCNRVESPCFL